MIALEECGRKLILPVWHGIDKTLVAAYSPVLADRVASDSARGIAKVAAEISEAVLRPSPGALGVQPSLARRFLELLETVPDASEILSFLPAHPDIPRKALGYLYGSVLRWQPTLGDSHAALAVGGLRSTAGVWDWALLNVTSLFTNLFLKSGEPIAELADSVRGLENLRVWIERNPVGAREVLPGIVPGFRGVVVAGRRYRLPSDQRESLGRYNERLSRITVRTYDWLAEAAASE